MRLHWSVAMLFATLEVTLGAQSLTVEKPEAVGLSSQRLSRIGTVLGADVDKGRLPGAVVAVARKGKLVYYEAFGFLDKPNGIPMPKDGIFSIASMTKPLVAVGTLMLYEENKLLVNDPVGKYLPQLDKMSVAVMDPSGRTVVRTEPVRRKPTLQDLMRHTAGIPLGSRGDSDLHKKYPQGSSLSADTMTGPEFVDKHGALPLHSQPGTTWDYGFGFEVLGLVVESIAKQSLGAFLKERLFGPLGMNETAFVLSAEKAKRFAKALPKDPETGGPQVNRDPMRPWKFDCGGGCAFATASDYLRFGQMLLNRGELDGTRILGPKTVEYMTADHLGPEVNIAALRDYPNINGYGFGLSVAVRRGSGVAGVMGSPGDYNWGGANGTFFWVDPQEELVAVFMAATPGVARLHYRQVITSLVLQSLVD